MKSIVGRSPRLIARIAGLIYVLVFVTGIFSLFSRSRVGMAAGLIAGLCYLAVTVLFYFIFRPAGPRLSLLAAIISVAGILIGPLGLVIKAAGFISPLVFFGFYCALIALLILKSTFLPRFLAVLMAFAGLGWLTFLWPPFAISRSPYIFLPGIIGEGMLTLWLVLKGVDERQWHEQSAKNHPR